VAAGVLYPRFGLTLSPIIAAAAMSLSSLCVVACLRLGGSRYRWPKLESSSPWPAALTRENTLAIFPFPSMMKSGAARRPCVFPVGRFFLPDAVGLEDLLVPGR